MIAAEAAITDLRSEAEEAKSAARSAKVNAESALRSAKRWQALTVVLGIVVVVLLAVSCFGVVLWYQQREATTQLKQQAISSCEIGNDRSAATIAVIDQLVTLLEGPSPSAAVQEKASEYEKFVNEHNVLRDCQQAYSSSTAATP
jgi:negative regulator of sigma E activity